MTRPRIFVHTPSYRDRELPWTLRDMYEKAAHPGRVFAGICLQLVPGEDDDLLVELPRPEQVRVDHVDAALAEGLGWARQRSQALWQGEEFCLQIDSHMRFVQDWDEIMLSLQSTCGPADAVLTHYPASYEPPDARAPFTTPYVQRVKGWMSNGMLQFTTDTPPDGAYDRPFPTAGIAGGFLFGPSRMLTDVPADPAIYFLGEEPSLAVRLWTHGFDLFSPHITVLYHYYGRREGARHWHDSTRRVINRFDRRADARMRALVTPGLAPAEDVAALGMHGLGSARTLAEYEAYSGVNHVGRTIAASALKYPWVRPSARRDAFALEGLMPVADHTLFVLGDDGIVFTVATGRILTLNAAATFAWCALEQGWDWERIAAAQASQRGVSVDEARETLRDMADHWLGAGLLHRPAESAGKPAQIVGLPRFDRVAHDLRTHHYRLLDTTIEVRAGGSALEALSHAALAHLAVPESLPDVVITHVGIAGWYFLFSGTDLHHHGQDPAALLPILKSTILTRATARQKHILHLHSAAVLIEGRLALLPGQSGSGKTWLTARLMASGAAYFTDETVLVAKDGTVRPVPTALSFKAGGGSAIDELYPALLQQPIHQREDQVMVRYLPPPPATVARDQPVRPSLCVFPRYVEGAPLSIRPLTPAETLARLIKDCIAVPRALSLACMATLVEMVEGMEAYEMVCGDLDAAAAAIIDAARVC